jgi:shikimate dehydrogenase
VNVVAQRQGKLIGFNTDTVAVTKSLDRSTFGIEGQRALVLGAGGAARAAAYALGKAGASEVVVANRTFARARELCAMLSDLGIEAVASPASPGALREMLPMSQIVVNATSVGLQAQDQSPVPADATFDSSAIAIDMVYRPLKTKFLAQAREQGVQTIDGLDILIQQAIASLSVWLGKPVDGARYHPLMRAAALEALL